MEQSAKSDELEKFKRKISSTAFNEELIDVLKKHIDNLGSVDEKILYLYYSKKTILQVERKPDQAHFEAFREYYDMDKRNFNPIKWIGVELEFWNNIKALTSDNSASNEIAQAKLTLSKSWLTQDEVQEMFKFSRSTLNRRIAEGMPFHQKGKSKFFNLEQISEWLKEDEAA